MPGAWLPVTLSLSFTAGMGSIKSREATSEDSTIWKGNLQGMLALPDSDPLWSTECMGSDPTEEVKRRHREEEVLLKWRLKVE